MFDSDSRYYQLETITINTSGGREVAYKSRRFLPIIPSGQPIAEHVVKQGERLDVITAMYLGNPQLFWQLCDVNNAMHPQELTDELVKTIRISLLQG
jgi:hypothetical protein